MGMRVTGNDRRQSRWVVRLYLIMTWALVWWKSIKSVKSVSTSWKYTYPSFTGTCNTWCAHTFYRLNGFPSNQSPHHDQIKHYSSSRLPPLIPCDPRPHLASLIVRYCQFPLHLFLWCFRNLYVNWWLPWRARGVSHASKRVFQHMMPYLSPMYNAHTHHKHACPK